MAEAKVDFSEKQHLECPVYFQPYNTLAHKPKMLPCGHSFCLGCLGKIRGETNSITCPKDRKQFTIPSESVDSFPNNFTVLEILTNLCDNCGGQPKQQVCLEEHCSMSLCDGCWENHRQSFHLDLRAALTDLKQEATKCDDDSDIPQLEDSSEAAIAEVTKLCDELKHNLIEEIKASKEKSMESYFDWKVIMSASAAESKVNAQMLLSQIGLIYNTNKPCKVLTNAHRQINEMKTKLAKKKNSKPALLAFKMENLKKEFDAFLLKLCMTVKPLLDIAKVDSLMVQEQASGGQSGLPNQQTQATAKPDYTRATLHTTYGKRGSGEGEFSDPNGISISPVSNQVAVVDQRNHSIHLLTDSLRPVSVFGEEGDGNNQYKYPQDVTITDRGVMFITDNNNHRVQATDSSGILLYMFGSEGTGQDQFQYPTGIASTHDHLYICDSNNYRVKVTLHDGTYVRESGTEGPEPGQFRTIPYFILVSDAQHRAVISDQSGNIHMFTLTGEFMRVIKSNQPHGNLLVADHKGKQLVVLGEQNQLLTTIGSGQLREPYGVALTLSGDIVVCDSSEKCVKLFKVPNVNKL